MQHDPLLYVDVMGLYQYVGNMPTGKMDPLGKECESGGDKCDASKNPFDNSCNYCGANGGGGFLILEANYLIKLVITMIDAITTIMLPTKEKEVK